MPFTFRLLKQKTPEERFGSQEAADAFARTQRFQNKFVDRFARRFSESVRDMQALITEELVRASLASNSANPILQAIPKTAFERLAKQEEETFEESLDTLLAELLALKGTAEARKLVDDLRVTRGGEGIRFAFDIINPHTVPWIQQNSANLVKNIDETTRQALREIVETMVMEGIPPRSAARLIRETVGLTPRQAAAVLSKRQALIAQGVTEPALSRTVNAQAKRMLRDRAETIARTEISRAESQGQLDAWRTARDVGLLDADQKRRWVASPFSPRTDATCRKLHFSEPVGLDEPFVIDEGEFMSYPAHPRCRCTTVLVFDEITEEERAAGLSASTVAVEEARRAERERRRLGGS